MMLEHSVQTYPAIPAAIQTREGVEQFRRVAIDAKPASALQSGMTHVHADVLAGSTSAMAKLASGQCRSSNGYLCGSTDRKRGREHRIGSTQYDFVERACFQTGRLPQFAKYTKRFRLKIRRPVLTSRGFVCLHLIFPVETTN